MQRSNPWLWVALAVLVLVVLVPFAGAGVAGFMGPGGMMGWGYYGGNNPYGWPVWLTAGIGLLMMVLFWGAVIVGGYFLVRALSQSGNRSAVVHSETPLDILKRRYAAGELTKEEYDRMRQDLER
ncbi:MAG: SHOCT domain-containing protein [Chloroflexi bacterium]|nr:SHOCT domain-containing protein [Chloroflexota bacterium]